MKVKLFLTLIFIFFFSLCMVAENSEDEVVDNFVFQEEVMLHLDRGIYISGENIFFSAYTLDAAFGFPVDLSKILYVELFDQDNIPVKQLKVALEDGFGTGYIKIPKVVLTDYYYIRAYTNYMKNFGPAHYATRRISIINPFIDELPDKGQTKTASTLKIDYFPEGGKLVPDVQNNILIRISGSKSPVNGVITTTASDTIMRFTTDTSGFAQVTFAPENGIQYQLAAPGAKSIKMKPSNDQQIILQQEKANEESVVFRLRKKGHVPFPLTLFCEKGGLSQVVRENIVANADTIIIPKRQLPKGLSSFRLLTKENHEVAHKWVYVPYDERVKMELKFDNERFHPGDSAVLIINITGKQDEPVLANASATAVFVNDKDMENPSVSSFFRNKRRLFYPHINESEFVKIVGSEKASWPYLFMLDREMQPKFKPAVWHQPETKGDVISGKVTSKSAAHPEKVEVMHSFLDSTPWVHTAFTDTSGRFFMTIKPGTYSDKELILRVKEKSGQHNIQLDSEFSPDYMSIAKKEFSFLEVDTNYIRNLMLHVQVQDAYYSSQISKDVIQRKEASLPFYGNPDYSYNLTKYVHLPNFEEFIFEILKGVKTTVKNDKKLIHIYSPDNSFIIGNDPLLLIDGVPVFDPEIILKLKPAELKKVNVVVHKYFFENQVFDGILDISTKKGNASMVETSTEIFRINFQGLQKPVPSYPHMALQKKDHIPDYRNLLFWEKVVCNSESAVKLQLKIPDYKGKFLFHCAGITKNGQTVYASEIIHVK